MRDRGKTDQRHKFSWRDLISFLGPPATLQHRSCLTSKHTLPAPRLLPMSNLLCSTVTEIPRVAHLLHTCIPAMSCTALYAQPVTPMYTASHTHHTDWITGQSGILSWYPRERDVWEPQHFPKQTLPFQHLLQLGPFCLSALAKLSSPRLTCMFCRHAADIGRETPRDTKAEYSNPLMALPFCQLSCSQLISDPTLQHSSAQS